MIGRVASALVMALGALAVGVPLVIVVLGAGKGFVGEGTSSVGAGFSVSAGLVARTILVPLMISLLAAMLAIPAAWMIRCRGAAVGALLVCPMLLPNYLVYSAWGTLRAPPLALGAWLETGDPAVWRAANFVQAVLGLALWSWPIASVMIAFGARRISDEALDSLRISDLSSRARLATILAMLRWSIVSAVGVVFVLMLGSAIPLHVAQIDTWSISIWRLFDETGGASKVWLGALPLILVGVASGLAIGSRLINRVGEEADISLDRRRRAPRIVVLLALGVWMMSVVLPFVLFLVSLDEIGSLMRFAPSGAEALGASAPAALACGLVGGVVLVTTAWGLSGSAGTTARRIASVSLRCWLIGALVPGVLIGRAIAGASTLPGMGFLTATDMGLITAHVARFGAVAALLGWWTATTEPRQLADTRDVFARGSIFGWAWSMRPAILGGIIASFGAMAMLGLHEIEAAVLVTPPRAGPAGISQYLLSLLHYLRDEQLSAAAVWILGVGTLGALLVSLLAAAPSLIGRGARFAPILLLLLLVPACSPENDGNGDTGALDVRLVIGSTGRGDGQFVYPRAIDCDGESLWIIDKTARLQRLSTEGDYRDGWTMPSFDRGKPVGVTCARDGHVYVADTHEHSIAVYATDGSLRHRFGAYGTDPGQFIFPTDVEVLTDESGITSRIYVSEYGGNDRVTAFSAAWDVLFSFGSHGSSRSPEDVQFSRPQSLELDTERGVLWVSDAANHRVGRFTLDGQLIDWIGRTDGVASGELGAFCYPYGLALREDGSVLVAEYGNNRVQLIAADGQSRGVYGVPGRAEGQLVSPWGVASNGKDVFVLDSGNNRVQVTRIDYNVRADP